MKSTIDFEFLSTLDANSGYHQIHIHAEDKEKTYFITEEMIFLLQGNAFCLEKYMGYLWMIWSIKCSSTRLRGSWKDI
jgi:hypothetical protein